MAIALYSFKIDEDGKVRLGHLFFAKNEAAAKKLLEEHASGCPTFGPAYRAGKTIEIEEETDELPEADEDSLLEFLGLGDGDEDEDDSDTHAHF